MNGVMLRPLVGANSTELKLRVECWASFEAEKGDMDDVLLKETGLIWENGGHQTISAHTTRFFFGGSVYLKGIQQLCSF